MEDGSDRISGSIKIKYMYKLPKRTGNRVVDYQSNEIVKQEIRLAHCQCELNFNEL